MTKNIVFFDGECNLCVGSVQWVIRNDNNNRFRFSSLQGIYAAKMIVDPKIKDANSMVLLRREKFYVKSTAVLMIAFFLRFPVNILSVFLIVPPFIRNWVYDIVANNRFRWFGKKTECWLPTEALKSKFIA